MIKKEEIEKLAQIKGNTRGAVFQTHAIFIKKKRGSEGLKAIEKKMAELGYPVDFKKIKNANWYPEFLSILIILMAKELFNWTEKDIFEMGEAAPRYSFISRILIAYFLSFKRFMVEVPKYWKKHLDIGELEVVESDEVKKRIILHEKGYKFHPLACVYHAGYYQGVAKYVVKSEKISTKETKCVFKGDPYNEYTITWE